VEISTFSPPIFEYIIKGQFLLCKNQMGPYDIEFVLPLLNLLVCSEGHHEECQFKTLSQDPHALFVQISSLALTENSLQYQFLEL
jgi:hypothetical protein